VIAALAGGVEVKRDERWICTAGAGGGIRNPAWTPAPN
jgi:hypothetical protein